MRRRATRSMMRGKDARMILECGSLYCGKDVMRLATNDLRSSSPKIHFPFRQNVLYSIKPAKEKQRRIQVWYRYGIAASFHISKSHVESRHNLPIHHIFLLSFPTHQQKSQSKRHTERSIHRSVERQINAMQTQ